MFCPKCGNEVKDGAKFCAKCGWAVPVTAVPTVVVQTAPVEKRCASCGTALKDGVKFCPKCGGAVSAGGSPVTPPPVSIQQQAAVLLAQTPTTRNKNWFANISLVSIILCALTFFHYNATWMFGIPGFFDIIPYWPDSCELLFSILGSVFGGISVYKQKSKFSIIITIISTILLLINIVEIIYNYNITRFYK